METKQVVQERKEVRIVELGKVTEMTLGGGSGSFESYHRYFGLSFNKNETIKN